VGGWEKTKRDDRGSRLSDVVYGCLVRQLLAGVVGLDGLGLDEDRGVATLDVGRGGRDGAGDVARCQNSGGSDDHQGNCCPDDFHDLCFHSFRKLRLAVQRILYHVPQVRVERLVAVRGVLLRTEGLLILNDLRQVFPSCMNATRDSRKVVANCNLIRGDRRGTGYSRQATQKQTRASRVGGCGNAVRGENHLLVGCVLGLFVDLGECTTDGFDCVGIFDFSHNDSALFSD